MKSHSILAPMFGPIGDSLMAIAFFDDILRLDPHASFCMITRHNASIIADLAHAYQQIEVRQIPSGFASIPFFLKLLREPRTLVAAFGDNAFDVAMLSQASVPVAVRPKQRLRDRAADVQLLVEIARES